MEDVEKVSKRQVLRELIIYFLVWGMFLGTPFSFVMANPNPPENALPSGYSTADLAPGDFVYGGNRLDISDVANGAVINWQNFDIGSLSTVEFHQVSSDAYVLNRVNAADHMATGIAGQLLANGGVFVVNPRGLSIAPTAYISANTFVGAAMNIDAGDFKDFANGVTNELEFNGALLQQGKVLNEGHIIGQKIALVGKQVENLGTIRTSTADGLVVLAAGDKVKLGHNGCDVFVDVCTGILPNNVDNTGSIRAGQITNNGDGTFDVTDETGGNVILAAGDIYSTALPGLASLRAEATSDIELAGPGTTTATGDVELLAGRHIDIDSGIDAGGNLTLYADASGNAIGDMHSTSSAPLSAGGSIDIRGNDIELGAAVTAGGDLTITGRDCNPDGEWGNVWAKDTLSAGGNIDISVTGRTEDKYWVWDGFLRGHWEYYTEYHPGTITLDGDVTAGGNLSLYNDTYAGAGITLQAGQNVFLVNDDLGPTEMANCTLLQGTEELKVVAGDQIHAEDTLIEVTGSKLTLQQGQDLDLANFMFDNQENTHLTLISDGGSVIADDTKAENASNQWDSISAWAMDDIVLVNSGSKVTELGEIDDTGKALVAGGNIDITAFSLINEGYGNNDIEAGGNLNVDALHEIRLSGDVYAGGDISLMSDTDLHWGSHVSAEEDLIAGGSLTIKGMNVWLDHGAQAGDDITITAHGVYELRPDHTNPDTAVRIGSGDVVSRGAIESTGGSVTITAFKEGPLESTHGYAVEEPYSSEGYNATGSIKVKDVTAATSIDLTAGNDIEAQNVTAGTTFDAEAGRHITLTGDAQSGGNMTLTANTDLTDGFSGDVIAYGNLISTGGDIEISASDQTIYLNGDLVQAAGNVTLNNTTKLDGAADQRIDAQTGTLTAKRDVDKISDGSLTLAGGTGIELADDVSTSNGNLVFEDDVIANGTGSSRHQLFNADGAGTDLIALGNITKTTGGDLNLDGGSGSDAKIYVAGNVTTYYGDLTFEDDVVANGTGSQTLESGSMLDNSDKNLHVMGSVAKTADGDLTMIGEYQVKIDGDVDVANGKLTVKADQDVTIKGSAAATGDVLLVADEDGDNLGGDLTVWGNVLSDNGAVKGYATDDIRIGGDVTAATDIELEAGDGRYDSVDVGGSLIAGGNIGVFAGDDISIDGSVNAGGAVAMTSNASGNGFLGGNVTIDGTLDGDTVNIEAGRNIYLGDDATSRGDMILTANTDENDGYSGDLIAKGDLTSTEGSVVMDASENTIHLYGDVTAGTDVWFKTNAEFEGWYDQSVDAGGMIIADGYLRKLNDFWACCNHYWSDGSLYLHANGDISLAGDVIAAICCPCDCWSVGGGVSIISDTGSIYTPGKFVEIDGELLPALAIDIVGRSDHFNDIGVDLPFGPGKAAIVIKSAEDLVLHRRADLTACGTYYQPEFIEDAWTLDDRAGVHFLTQEETILDVARDPGTAFDAAIYLGSTDADVHVDGEVRITSREMVEPMYDNLDVPREGIYIEYDWTCVPRGAMIVDAYDTITFGAKFLDSLAEGLVGDRLEVCSRISEWLEDAIGRLPFPEDLVLPEGYNYVMRGSGDTDEPAWVLEEEPFNLGAPLPQLEAVQVEGCPASMQAAAGEIGIAAETIQLSINRSLAANPNIQPCEACESLVDSAAVLQDPAGTRLAAMGQVLNQFVAGPTPPAPGQMASIRMALAEHVDDGTFYAAAREWDDALAAYVAAAVELGLAQEDTMTALAKYVPADDATLSAYVAARLSELGG